MDREGWRGDNGKKGDGGRDLEKGREKRWDREWRGGKRKTRREKQGEKDEWSARL